MTALFDSVWPAEDGGPRRLAAHAGGFAGLRDAVGGVEVRHREALGATMVVTRGPGEAFLHGHGIGEPTCWVERIDPVTLETIHRIDGLPGGPTWPGGIAAHADGALLVVFGRHAHRLSADLELEASRELPRDAAYNSFVVLPDGHIVTKDFGGLRPGVDPSTIFPPAELLVLEPESLAIVDRTEIPEPSIARLSADGDTVVVVGDHSLFRLDWDGSRLSLDDRFAPRYRTIDGQTHGWDAVLALGAAWFLDDGAGAEDYAGTFRGHGVSTAPLHLVRIDLTDARVDLTEICGLPGGLIANPPLIDESRRIAVGYDSGNGVLTAFDIATDGSTAPRWSVQQDHASHLLLDPVEGLFLSADHDGVRFAEQLVVRDIATGEEIVRAESGSPLQSVVFPAFGESNRVYACTFSTLSSLSW